MLVIGDSVVKLFFMRMRYIQMICFFVMGALVADAGTPAQAEAIVQEHKTLMAAWQAELAGARSMEMMRQIEARKPNIEDYKKRMIRVVGAEFKHGWSLKYAGWLLRNTPLGKKDVKFIMDYANKYHMGAPDLGLFCYDVALSRQPMMAKKLFIEKARKVMKNKQQRGVAAIALAVVLSDIGDTGLNNARRLTLVKEAIIHANDVKLGGTAVSDVAMEMVYRLKNLCKNCVAPAFVGVDSSGSRVSLSDYRGKAVMLVFWSSFDLSNEKTIELLALMRKVEKQYVGKQFALIGVNKDQIGNLRELEKGRVTTRVNLSDPQQAIFKKYRVGTPPHCYVIDKQGRIQFSGIVGSFATLTVDAILNPPKRKSSVKGAKRVR